MADEVSYASPELGHHYDGRKTKSMGFLPKKTNFQPTYFNSKTPYKYS